MTLGERLKKCRDKIGLSQIEVCRAIGLANSATLSNYERDERTPDPEVLKQLAIFYNVSLDELLGVNAVILKDGQLEIFKERLLLLRTQKKISRSELGAAIDKDEEYIRILETTALELPSVEILYELANRLDCTPDYLGGFIDERNGVDPNTPKPKDLTDFIEKNMIMYNGVPLSKEDKQKIFLALQAVFYDSKFRK